MNIIFLDSCIVIDYINGKLQLSDTKMKSYCWYGSNCRCKK